MCNLNITDDVCETLEDLLKIINFRSITIKNCNFTTFTMCEFFSLLEYYDPTTEIILAQNILITEAWKMFCNALSKCNSLESVTLKDQTINDQHLRTFLLSIRANNHITTLKFENCESLTTSLFHISK